jgi:hypothetical protein
MGAAGSALLDAGGGALLHGGAKVGQGQAAMGGGVEIHDGEQELWRMSRGERECPFQIQSKI